jgi:hypothetical protein
MARRSCGARPSESKDVLMVFLLRSACEGLAFDRFRQMLPRLVFERSGMDR